MGPNTTQQSSNSEALPDWMTFAIIGVNLLFGMWPLLMVYSWRAMSISARDMRAIARDIGREEYTSYMNCIDRIKKELVDLGEKPMFLVGNMFLNYRQLNGLLKKLRKNPEVAEKIEAIVASELTKMDVQYSRYMPRFKQLYIDETPFTRFLEHFIQGQNPYTSKSPFLFREVGKLLKQSYKNVEDDFTVVANLVRMGFTGENTVLIKILDYYRVNPVYTLAQELQELFGPQAWPMQDTLSAYNFRFTWLAERHLDKYKEIDDLKKPGMIYQDRENNDIFKECARVPGLLRFKVY